jgi:hypothetical protein
VSVAPLGEAGVSVAVAMYWSGRVLDLAKEAFEEIREAVSDRGDGVRSRGEAACKGRRNGKGAPRS